MNKKNFGAGPSVMPTIVLERAAKELIDFHGTGCSIVEVSHRSPEYELVQAKAIDLLRELMQVPKTHEILLMQGGTRTHFSYLAENFLGEDESADYIITGHWARQAFEQAAVVRKNVRIAGDSVDASGKHLRNPLPSELDLSPDARYVHICSNNTIAGTQWREWPDTGDVPLVMDMTSDILSRPVDWTNVGLAYAGSQKNLGPSGVVVVVVRKDFLETASRTLPSAVSYRAHSIRNSLLYTPTTFSVLTMQLLLERAHEIGGMAKIVANNKRKARLLYAALEKHPKTYDLPCEKESRSLMNVTFTLKEEGATRNFLMEASRRGMIGLKGHRSRGGIRASIYNWSPLEDVVELAAFVEEFASSGLSKVGHDRPQQLRRDVLLKVEYRHQGNNHFEYVKNLSLGGLLLAAELPVGQRIKLRLSFLGFLAPITIDAQIRWSEPDSDEGEAQSGVEFIDVDDTAKKWLTSIVGMIPKLPEHKPRRVLLIEQNTFLREIYTQEVVNWAEVHGDHVEFVSPENDGELAPASNLGLAIIDLDGLEKGPIEVLEEYRERFGDTFPLIFLGGLAEVTELNERQDTSLFALSKPLNFGQLMDTVGIFFAMKPVLDDSDE